VLRFVLPFQSDSQHKMLILGSKHPEITATWRSELGRIRARLLAAAGTPAQPTVRLPIALLLHIAPLPSFCAASSLLQLHSFGSSAGDDEPSVHVHSDREHFRAHKKGFASTSASCSKWLVQRFICETLFAQSDIREAAVGPCALLRNG